MTLNVAMLIILLLIAVFFLFVEVFTVLFMITGMTERKARFQVISILTNTGFTTAESEIIASSRRRRRLAIVTMLFGYIYAVAIVSMVINAMLAVGKGGLGNPINTVVMIVVAITVMLGLKRIPVVKERFDGLVRKAGSRLMFHANSNPLLVLDYYGESAIVEIRITELPEQLKDKTLMESRVKADYGIQIFAIKRAHETRHEVGPDDILKAGDRIVAFGSLKNIHALFRMRPSFSAEKPDELSMTRMDEDDPNRM